MADGRDDLWLLRMLQQAPGFICFLRGPAHVFELANDAYLRLIGRRDIVGKGVRDALPELAGQGFYELLDRVYETREPYVGNAVKVMLQQTSGPLAEAFVDFIYQPIVGDDGGTLGILVQGSDVTRQVRQAMEREDAMSRFEAMFDAIDDGFCIMQMLFDEHDRCYDYRFLVVNAAFEEHTGLRGALGRTARELVPDLDQSWFDIYGDIARSGQARRFENHAPAMGRWFEVYAARVGKPERRQVALVFKNTTARVELEQERAALLERERAARADAERANQMKDEFLATVSHELRTPLSSMLGWVQLLRGGTLAVEKHERALETIERNARAQAQLIDDLLDVSRILSGKLKLELETVDVAAVVEHALESVQPAAAAKDIRVQVALDSTSSVLGDPARLQQIAWNLLSNAVKFTPKGGKVQVFVERRASAVELTVTDTGRGIDPAFLPHVFDRFRQASGSTARAYGGLGLGLSIVKHLVEAHGGAVTVTSDGEGKGATFVVRLPLAAATRRTVLPVGPSTDIICPPELAGIRVLLVDDDDDTREVLKVMLEQCSITVATAASARDALALLAASVPDVLVSDVGMPDEDGYSLIRRVRAGGGPAAKVPAVALTAFARAEDRTRALLGGFDSHVAKPVHPIELLAVLSALTARTR